MSFSQLFDGEPTEDEPTEDEPTDGAENSEDARWSLWCDQKDPLRQYNLLNIKKASREPFKNVVNAIELRGDSFVDCIENAKNIYDFLELNDASVLWFKCLKIMKPVVEFLCEDKVCVKPFFAFYLKKKQDKQFNQDACLFLREKNGDFLALAMDGMSILRDMHVRGSHIFNLALQMYVLKHKKMPESQDLNSVPCNFTVFAGVKRVGNEIWMTKLGDARAIIVYNDHSFKVTKDEEQDSNNAPNVYSPEDAPNIPKELQVVKTSYPRASSPWFKLEAPESVKEIWMFSDGVGDNLPQTKIIEIIQDSSLTSRQKIETIRDGALQAMKIKANHKEGQHYGKPDDIVVMCIDVEKLIQANSSSVASRVEEVLA